MTFFSPKVDIGIAYFIKNGKVETKNIKIDLKELESAKTNTANGNLFDSYIKRGYSIVINYKDYENWTNMDKTDLTRLWTFLSPSLTNQDAVLVNRGIKNLEKMGHIRNYQIRNLWQNFDYDYTSNYYQNEPCSVIVDYFVREKLNQLTEEEQVMFQKYREFNLQEILLDDIESKYPINHRNAGVIYISKNQTFCNTVKKKQHGNELDSIIPKIYPTQKIKEMDFFETVRTLSDVTIQLLHHEVLIWIPENYTQYQKEQLSNFLTQLKAINEVCFLQTQENLNISWGIVHSNIKIEPINDVEEYVGLESFQDFLDYGIDYVRNKEQKTGHRVA